MKDKHIGQSNEQKKSQAYAVFGMGSCYALGTFTDNFFKQCIVLLAASLELTSMQSYATVLFSLPFILFSAWAGWLADRLPKKYIVVAVKSIELAALVVGAVALVQGSWGWILGVLFFMGLQSTFFSPALNGSIPETFPLSDVPKVNSFIKLASTAAVLAGIAIAGIFMDFRAGVPLLPEGILAKGIYFDIAPETLQVWGIFSPDSFGRAAAGGFICCVALLGVFVALTLQKHPSSLDRGVAPQPFPLAGPLDSVRYFFGCRKDRSLFIVLLAEAFFYGIAAIAVISISNLSARLGYSDTVTSMFSAILMVGIATGALIAGRKPVESWKQLLPRSSFGMGIFLLFACVSPFLSQGDTQGMVSLANTQFMWLGASFFLCGLCGGIYLIPLASYIQVRPSASEKGKVLGVSNFASFVAIACFGIVFYIISFSLENLATLIQTTLPLPPDVFASAATFVVYGLGIMLFTQVVVIRGIHKLGEES